MSHPATPVLALSLLVGSQAINTLALKNEMLAYTRATEGKLALLKGVIERVQKGEEFDVDEVLGTGKVTEEGEWFDGEYNSSRSYGESIGISCLHSERETSPYKIGI